MKRVIWFLPVVLAALIGRGAVGAPAGASQALLTDVRGAVQVVRGGKTLPGKSGMKLLNGDVVKVARGSATVFYESRPPQPLQNGQQVKVAAAVQVASSAGMWRNSYASIASGFDRRAEEVRLRGGGLRDGGSVVLITPVNTIVDPARLVLVWEPLTSEEIILADYAVSLRDADGETIWETTTKGTSAAYPASAPALQPGGKYTWSVTPRETTKAGEPEPREGLASRSARLDIATEADTAAARGEGAEIAAALKALPAPTRRTLQAAALAKRGFLADAIATLLPEVTPEVVARGAYIATLDRMLPALDESSRVLLRSLYLDTKQEGLAKKVDALKP